MFERFTDGAREAIVLAQAEAIELRHNYLGTEHLLLGVTRVTPSVSGRVLRRLGIEAGQLRASLIREVGWGPTSPVETDTEALRTLGIDLDEVRKRIEAIFGPGALDRPAERRRRRRRCEPPGPTGHIPFTPRAKKVLELSLREARHLGHNYIGSEHILLGLARERDGLAARLLAAEGVTYEVVCRAVIGELARGGIDPPGETA